MWRRPESIGAKDLGRVIAVRGREVRPPLPLGQPAVHRGALLTLSITPDGVGVGLDVDGARIRVLLDRPA